jgi:PAS domain S-box-containing protein
VNGKQGTQSVSNRPDSEKDETLEVTAAKLRALNDELKTKTNRLELAWEAARGGVFEHRIPIDDSTYISEQWAQVLGYRLEDLPHHNQLLEWLAEQAHPQDRERWRHTYSTLIEGKANRYSIELRFRHRSGRWIWVRKIAKSSTAMRAGFLRISCA